MSSLPSASVRNLSVYESPGQARLRSWIQLARTHNLLCREISAMLAAQRVTLPQFDVLATLRFSGGVTQQELAERLLVTKGNVCQVLDRLERLGWVERRPDPADARANRLHLTPAGRRKIGAVLPRHDALVLDATRTLSQADVKSLCRLLKTLERGITSVTTE